MMELNKSCTGTLRQLSILRKSIVTFLALAFLFSTGLVSADAQEYNVHVGPNGYVPYVIVKRDGTEVSYYGLMFDFLDAFEAAHPEFKRKHMLLTRKRVNAKMAKGEDIDVMLNSPLFVSSKILQHYQFTDTLLRTEDKVITRKDQNFNYKEPHDLVGKTVGTIRGYGYGHLDFLMRLELFEDIRVDTHAQALGMLHKKRIDAYIGNNHVTPLYIKQLGLNVSDFDFSDVSLYQFNIGFAVNKRRPELYEQLNKFLVQYVADGSFDTLLRGYIE